MRDNSERDLGAHLETALRGIVIGERWPKSGVDVVITILEGEEDGWWGDEVLGVGGAKGGGWGLMSVLGGCITVACAALVEAGIDCVDLVSGGVAAVIRDATGLRGKGLMAHEEQEDSGDVKVVLDPCPSEHVEVLSACVVGYLASRDEVTELWMKGFAGAAGDELVDQAVQAAVATRTVLAEAIKEAAQAKSFAADGT